MILNHEHVGEFVIVWYCSFWASIIKGIIDLQSFCVVLVGWVFIKTGKGRKETFFSLGVF
jgi:hypothetical protein